MSALMRKCANQVCRTFIVGVHRGNYLANTRPRCLCVTARLLTEEDEKPFMKPVIKNWKYVYSDAELKTGIQYMESEEYTEKYGKKPVWVGYRRNHKGHVPPMKTRKQCIRGDKMCSNACPICRDQNLVLHFKNVKLLQQFICPHSGQIYKDTAVGVCQKQYEKLNNVIEEAKFKGLLPFTVTQVEYDYDQYYGNKEKKSKLRHSS
ncbi:small ribosomal subunit protein mS40-like [Saccoglossus kowalevskii]|uniref:Small ribosomal subunit protein mS40 n=1 Tax=Saccoglossus kowalevskii TaxID=10224 RepID=A0ABM0GPD0_SACKO|nr:PREDICTED: 28S ribosomal protein S18b, mitochondrial-like [Saccoglossus kowalevskii]